MNGILVVVGIITASMSGAFSDTRPFNDFWGLISGTIWCVLIYRMLMKKGN